MKKILLISDTHGLIDPGLHKYFEQAHEVWHAGDIGTLEQAKEIAAFRPLRAVHGNIDGNDVKQLYPADLLFTCEGLRVVITHIGGTPGKYPARVKSMLKMHAPGLFICGHSHILKVVYDKELQLLHMNPGAAGKQGFHHLRTALRFTVEKGAVKDLEVIELGKRSG